MGKNDLAASAVMVDEATDPERWRLKDNNGRQTWHYLETAEEAANWPQTLADRHHLGLPLVSSTPLRHSFRPAAIRSVPPPCLSRIAPQSSLVRTGAIRSEH